MGLVSDAVEGESGLSDASNALFMSSSLVRSEFRGSFVRACVDLFSSILIILPMLMSISCSGLSNWASSSSSTSPLSWSF